MFFIRSKVFQTRVRVYVCVPQKFVVIGDVLFWSLHQPMIEGIIIAGVGTRTITVKLFVYNRSIQVMKIINLMRHCRQGKCYCRPNNRLMDN